MAQTIKECCDAIVNACAQLPANEFRVVKDSLLEIERLANVPRKIAKVCVRSSAEGQKANFMETYSYTTQADRDFVHSLVNQYRRAGYEVCIVTSERGV